MIPEDFHMPSILKDVSLDFDEDEEGAQSVNMMRIGNTIIDKDRIEYVELGKENDPEEVGLMMQTGRLFRWWGKEAEEVRAFLREQFPCENQTLWL